MDAGTWVALVLGLVGFAWGAWTWHTSRRDAEHAEERAREATAAAEREGRWVQEKRLIYADMLRALDDYLGAITDELLASPATGDKAQYVAATKAAWKHVQEVQAQTDLLAPEAVRLRVQAALNEMHGLIAIASGVAEYLMQGASSEDRATVEDAQWEQHLVLEAMRADLGVEPLGADAVRRPLG